MDKIKLDLNNPIFTFYINTEHLSRQRGEEIMHQMKEHFDIYENITVWFLASNENRIECVYNNKDKMNVDSLIEDINERIEILSQSSNFDDFKMNVRNWRINNLMNDKMNDEYIYFIAYPGGDKTKITVCYESYACEYEIKDYALASRRRWDSFSEANAYCKELAKNNNLIFVNSDIDGDGNDYLD